MEDEFLRDFLIFTQTMILHEHANGIMNRVDSVDVVWSADRVLSLVVKLLHDLAIRRNNLLRLRVEPKLVLSHHRSQPILRPLVCLVFARLNYGVEELL